MVLSVAIRQRIINLTKLKNISLKELSRRAGVPYPTLISFMSGANKTMNLSTLYGLCIGLDIDLVDFFDNRLFQDVLDEHEKEAT